MSTSRDTQLIVEEEFTTQREPIITKVLDQPQLLEVREVKNVSVIHKPVVQEIHEQQIIEIAKRPETVHIEERPFIQKTVAPTKYEDISNVNFGAAAVMPVAKAPTHTEEIGDIKRVDLTEEVKQITHQEFIERHIVPTVTEIHEQKVINVIEQPIIRTVIEQPIVREVAWNAETKLYQPATVVPVVEQASFEKVELRDSSLERQQELPVVQESTHVLLEKNPTGAFSDLEFQEELSRGPALLQSARPLASEEFKQEIKWGQEHLHTARPFSQEVFLLDLQKGKLALQKSRYFSKDAFIGEFMARKAILAPRQTSVYSRELATLGNWKTESLMKQATGLFWDTYASLKEKVVEGSSKVVDTYEHLKEKVVDSTTL